MWGKNTKPEPPPSPQAPPAEPPRRDSVPPREAMPAATHGAVHGGSRIGPGLRIRGDVRGSEDLLIDGEVQGSVRLEQATATVGRAGRVKADVEAREILVEGRVDGALRGQERVRIASTGVVHGNVQSQRVAIDEGAILHGAVETVRPGEAARNAPPASRSFAAAASAPQATTGSDALKSGETVAVASGSAASDGDEL